MTTSPPPASPHDHLDPGALAAPRPSLVRRASAVLHERPRLRLALLISAPLAWLVVAYVGALAALFFTALYRIDPFTTNIVEKIGGENFRTLVRESVYRSVAIRTFTVAAVVTVVDAAIAVPVAFYMAKVARPALRRFMVVGILMPLWASYLVKGYAWRAILNPANGVMKTWFGWSPGFGVVSTGILLAYLWLPYMILPVYAGLDRLPGSLLEASSDLGAPARTTFRHVVVPVLLPAIAAGSIFTFSLTMGDYIAVQIVGGTSQMIGNVVYRDFGANNIPFAASFALVPVVVMVVYLLAVRRSGAFENL